MTTLEAIDHRDIDNAIGFFKELQQHLCQRFEAFEPRARFIEDDWQRAAGGGGKTRVLAGGETFESAGVNFSLVHGDNMPASATAHRPELAGRSFTASGVSVVIHPNNPYVPTAHANVRLFVAEKQGADPIWWFGGGYDLTPYYPFKEDVIAWHRHTQKTCAPYGSDIYPRYKKWCDEYFYNKHRQEQRGVGGLFFDDLNDLGFERSFSFVQDVGHAFIDAYEPLIKQHKDRPYGQRERDFQLYRRGRYVEFNLVYDRGTLFGLQSGGRTESILMSMPPQAAWRYRYEPAPGSAEDQLTAFYLQPQNWLAPGHSL